MNPVESLVNSWLARVTAAEGAAGAVSEKNVLCEAAFEQFRQRMEDGEEVDPEEFAAQYPSCESSLLGAIAAHVAFDRRPDLLKEEPIWPELGDKLLGFVLLRQLGRGTFARVYLAQQPEVGGRLVVLKVAPLTSREAQTLGRLEHPNIVKVHSVDRIPARRMSVLCMPYLGEATLHDVLKRAFAAGKPPRRADVFRSAVRASTSPEVAEAVPTISGAAYGSGGYVEAVVEVARQLAEALAFVHARGICHRDLKPSNVLLGQDGRPMLLDFNLSHDPDVSEERLGGTLPYVSPEQLRALVKNPPAGAGRIDGRSDLYALGVILYQLLTGKHPFGLLNQPQEVEPFRRVALPRQRGGAPPLRPHNPEVDRPLEQIIARCLAFAPEDRFASAEELLAALNKWRSPARRAVRWVRRRPALLNVGVAALLIAAVGGAYQSQVPSFADRQHKQGMQAYQDKKYQKAIDALSNVLDEPSPPVDAYYYRGRAYLHVQPPDYSKAVKDFRRAAELAEADPLSKESYGKAVASAAFAYAKLADKDRKNAAEHVARSMKYCRKAIDAGFAKAIMYNNLGFYEARKLGGTAEAMKCYDAAIRLDDKLQFAYHNRARIDLAKAESEFGKMGYEPKDGIRDIETAKRLGPASPELHYDAFCLYVRAYKVNRVQNAKYLDFAKAEIEQLTRRGWLAREMAEDKLFQNVKGRLGIEVREADLKERKDLPKTLLVLDPVGD